MLPKPPMRKDLLKAEFPIRDLAIAFATDPRTLRRRLTAAGHERDVATVKTVHQCLSGDGSLESLRKSRKELQDQQAAFVAQRVLERDGELVDLTDLLSHLAPRIAKAIQIIQDSKLDDGAKFDLRAELSAVVGISTPPSQKAGQPT
jgi:hypothetical protein